MTVKIQTNRFRQVAKHEKPFTLNLLDHIQFPLQLWDFTDFYGSSLLLDAFPLKILQATYQKQIQVTREGTRLHPVEHSSHY